MSTFWGPPAEPAPSLREEITAGRSELHKLTRSWHYFLVESVANALPGIIGGEHQPISPEMTPCA